MRDIADMNAQAPEAAAYSAAWLVSRDEYFDGVYSDLLTLKEQGALGGKSLAIVGAWNLSAEIRDIIARAGLTLGQ